MEPQDGQGPDVRNNLVVNRKERKKNHKREEKGTYWETEGKAKLLPTIRDLKTQRQNMVMQVVSCF